MVRVLFNVTTQDTNGELAALSEKYTVIWFVPSPATIEPDHANHAYVAPGYVGASNV